MAQPEPQHQSKTALLNAALHVIRAKGYAATRVEDICQAADLTKGSFFHHFKSKEDLALAALEHWDTLTSSLFAKSDYRRLPDPLDRLLAYIDLRKSLLQGELPDFTCLPGTMLQETYQTHPVLRGACHHSIASHAATLEPDIAEAMRKYNIRADWTPRSLALYTQATIQGAFILVKAEGGPAIAAASLDHLRRYIEMLFNRPVTYGSELARLQSNELMRLQMEEAP